ncbi:hypothetical protein A2Z33_02145 [Candidatus Gottesmanbacteria bacterium RBG_16_52_11]|uniref:Uncharacterized protein n=1 Tax=Candidatus Gottesmanbacteria bacterium RBG_16_52_11 TaxID=1798374 RepID=A0A1F5YQW6_9BACT|nr:MAG: hypothetical protein A2Z33_02145 [Candidatus Gottesmanbacteria bacterium RBG_16_52_11]
MNRQPETSDQDGGRNYSSPDASTVHPVPPPVNFWKISTTILAAILVIGYVTLVKNNLIQAPGPGSAKPQIPVYDVSVTGVIRTAGLSDEEIQKYNLNGASFQITDINPPPENGIYGYFLLPGYQNTEKYLGSCVRVDGNIPVEWRNRSVDLPYYRTVLVPGGISETDPDMCSPYKDVNYPDTGKVKLEGTLIRSVRPAPDIMYDYQLKAAKPYLDQGASAGSPRYTSVIDIMPDSDAVWREMENLIGEDVSAEGSMLTGYAESRFFSVRGIGSPETGTVRNLVTRFEDHIRDRNVSGLMSLFTPAVTEAEISSYRDLMGLEPDTGSSRLFNNVTSNFIVTSWKIARRQYPDNAEMISKVGDTYFVTVEETRKSWCNAGDCVGTYSFENTGFYVFEIVKRSTGWLVDKYYPQPASPAREVMKYEALTF